MSRMAPDFETEPERPVARWLPWLLSRPVIGFPFGTPQQEVGFMAKIASLADGSYSYTHAPATDTPNRTEAVIDTVVAILKYSPSGKIDLSLSFKWFSRHRGYQFPIRFDLRGKQNNGDEVLLAQVGFKNLPWDCSCGPDPSRGLYQDQQTLPQTQQAFFNLVLSGQLVLLDALNGDKGPVC